jgi:hypothetical protein
VTELNVKRLRELLKAATPGPWHADASTPDDVVLWGPKVGDDDRFLGNVGGQNPSEVGVVFDLDAANAALIVEVVNTLPEMLDRLEAAAFAASLMREACAAKCEELADAWDSEQGTPDELVDMDHGDRLRNAAKVIRGASWPLGDTLQPPQGSKP